MNFDSLIRPQWQQILAREAATAEQQRVLTQKQLEMIFEAGWFRMFLPKSLGGLALDLPTALRLEEALARIDGSLGWTVTLCAGATLFAGFMEPSVAEELLADPGACFGGSGAATGVAEEDGEGYRITGFWKYATGAPYLSAFTANCRLQRKGEAMLNAGGQPLIRSFVFRADEVNIHSDWNVMGLCATAGDAFEVNNLWVPASRAFDIIPDAARLNDPIFRYPFLPFAETTLAVNSAGMARHFLDECTEIFAQKSGRSGHRNFYESLLREEEQAFEKLGADFYRAADFSWDECCASGACGSETLLAVSRASRALARNSRQLAARLFPYCGMAAIHPESAINRAWRDLFTASQHSLLNPAE
jgi:alkylation response protein AidB-like acyl-CoA dehydrogenase